MGKTEYLNMRLDGERKAKFWNFCAGTGMNASAVITLLAKKCVAEGKMPFEVVSTEMLKLRDGWKQGSANSERVSFRMSPELREQFISVCRDRIGLPASVVIKAFMEQCIKTGRIPFGETQGNKRTVKFLD